jgi:epoxyqueuosine reductase
MARKEMTLGERKRFTNEVKNYAIKEGVDLVGVASVQNYLKVQKPPQGHRPEDILPGAKNLVVMIVAGIDFPRLDKLVTLDYPGLEKPIKNYPLGTPEYNANNTTLQCGRGGYAHMDLLGHYMARFLIKNDFNAIPIGTGHPYFQNPLHGVMSHKHAAVQAGLGQMGLSSLFLSPEFGPNCYLVSTLTDAPLVADEPFKEDLCMATQKECKQACIRRCPQQALSFEWKGKKGPVPPGRGIVDKAACQKRFGILAGAMGYFKDIHHGRHHGITIHCGTCIRACPIGRRI